MAEKNNFEDAAADAQVFRRKEVTGDLNFVSNLDELDASLEADTIVCRFNNPDPEKEPIDFEMRPMTPGETAAYYNTLLANTLMGDGVGTPNADSDLDEVASQKIQDELDAKKYDQKLLNILEGCLLNPPGITAERLQKWDPFYIMRLHNALIKGSRPSKAVSRFPDVDAK